MLKHATTEGIGFATAASEIRDFLAGRVPAATDPPDPAASPAPSAAEARPWTWGAVGVLAAVVLLTLASLARRRRTRRRSAPQPQRLPPLDLTHEDLTTPHLPEESEWTR